VLEFVGEKSPEITGGQATKEVASVLRAALEDRLTVRIKYHKPPADPSWRTVTPLEVGDLQFRECGFGGLRAYCHDQRSERTFRLDRIVAVEVPEEP
jgi:predicted DNA-binding transcriptional regulator YafY